MRKKVCRNIVGENRIIGILSIEAKHHNSFIADTASRLFNIAIKNKTYKLLLTLLLAIFTGVRIIPRNSSMPLQIMTDLIFNFIVQVDY